MQTRDNHLIFKGLVVNIEQMDVQVGCKGWHTYQVVRHPGGVAVLPLHDDGSVTLIRQLRPAISTFTIELPAGRLEPGENPADCARRELLEETGLSGMITDSIGEKSYWFFLKDENAKCKKTVTYFLLKHVSGEVSNSSPEVDEVGWFQIDRAMALITFSSDREILSAAKEKIEADV